MIPKKTLAIFGIKFFPSKGGSSRVAESLIRELKDKYAITIYCFKTPESENFIPGVEVVSFPKLPFNEIGVFFYYTLCCLHLLVFKRFDLIHVHKTDSAIFIPLLRLKSKVIATSQEAPYTRDKWNLVGKTYFKIMEKSFVGSSALLTSVSKPLSEYYNRTYNRLVHYVPNGIEISNDRDFEAAERILNEYSVKGDFLLFAARRIMSTKGCHTFLEAMKKINYSGTIVIAGEASHAQAYMNKIKLLSKGLDVKYIGFVKGKATLLALVEKARFFIFPSETEGLSLMLLEVGSTGKTPLICSDIPENTQVFSDEHVLFFEDKNADDLAEKFLWAEQNMAEMERRMLSARNLVLNEYSEKQIASKYEALYQQLTG